MTSEKQRFSLPLLLSGVFLLAVIVISGVSLRRWAKGDTSPLAWDQALHTQVALDYRERLKSEGWLSLLKPAYFNYPPFYHWTLAPILGRTRDIADAGPLINFFYLSLLLISVFWVARSSFGEGPAIQASCLVASYPIVIDMARYPMIDLALTSFVAVSLLCLFQSQNFARRGWSLAFGFWFGLAMITKWTAFMYILGPLALCVVQAVRAKTIKGVGVSMAVAFFVMAPWYTVNFFPALTRMAQFSGLPPASGVVTNKWANWLWYPLHLKEQMSGPLLVLFLPGLVMGVRRPKQWPLALWFVLSLFLFSFVTNRNARYAMPALPAAALLSAAFFASLGRWPSLGFGVLIGYIFVASHFFPGALGAAQTFAPSAVNWQHDAIIEKVEALQTPGQFDRVVIVSNAPFFHSTSLNVSRRMKGALNCSFRGPSKRRWTELAPFILFKTGDIGPEFTLGVIKDYAQFIQSPPSWFSKVYKKKGEWPLPDGSFAFLYKAEPEADPAMKVGLLNLTLKELRLPHALAENVRLKATPLSTADTAMGQFKEIVLECDVVTYKGVPSKNVRVVLVHPQINGPLFFDSGEIQLLRLSRLRLDAELSGDSLVSLLANKAKWLKNPEVQFKGKQIWVKGYVFKIPLSLRVSLWVERGVLKTHLDHFSFAHVPFPLIFVRALTDRSISLTPHSQMPFALDIRSIEGRDGLFKIVS